MRLALLPSLGLHSMLGSVLTKTIECLTLISPANRVTLCLVRPLSQAEDPMQW
jgi:hypothetical protein